MKATVLRLYMHEQNYFELAGGVLGHQ